MTRAMGPIERELRGTKVGSLAWLSLPAMTVLRGTPLHYGRSTVELFMARELDDALTEAIEAAEALNL